MEEDWGWEWQQAGNKRPMEAGGGRSRIEKRVAREREAWQFLDASRSRCLKLKSGLDRREGGRRLKRLGRQWQWRCFHRRHRIKKGRLITAWDQWHADCQRENQANSQASSGIS